MRIIDIEPSSQECTQSGWRGVDISLDKPVTAELIQSWGRLGSLFYLPELKEPFYKVCSRDFVLRGAEGKNFLRMGCALSFLDNRDIGAVEAFLFQYLPKCEKAETI